MNTFNLLRHSTYFHVDTSNGEGEEQQKQTRTPSDHHRRRAAHELVMGVVVCATTAGPIVADSLESTLAGTLENVDLERSPRGLKTGPLE